MSLSDELLGLERSGWDALVAGTGRAFYERMLSDDAIMVVPGMALQRDDAIGGIDDTNPWSSYRIDDAQVVALGADAAAVVYVAEAVRDDVSYRAAMTTVYVRRDGNWRVALHQQTPL